MKIPGYKLLQVIATGGTSTVYLGIQKSLGRKVAVKVLDTLNESGQSERFLSEGKVIASLNHRNVITVHDVGKIRNYHYIAMEYLHGGSLSERIQGGMQISEIFHVLRQIGECLQYIHGRGLVHRDVKPGNILFHKDGRPTLSDFGIAKKAEQRGDETINSYALGSPYYVSPELVLGRHLDHRADLYGLGIVLYEMLTGHKPFRESTHIRTMIAHVNKPMPKLPRRYERFQPLLNKLIAKSPDERFGSAAEMIAELDRLEGKTDGLSLSAKAGYWARNALVNSLPGQRIAAAVALVFLIGGVSVMTDKYLEGLEPVANSPAPPPPEPVNTGFNTRSIAFGSGNPGMGVQSSEQMSSENDTDQFAAEIAALLAAIKQPETGKGQGLVDGPDSETSSGISGNGVRHSAYRETMDFATVKSQYVNRKNAGQIDHLISAAREAEDSYKLTRPSGRSAFDYYQSVLELDADNKEARNGLQRIVSIYAAMASKHLENEETELARLYVQRGLIVDPSSKELRSIGDKVTLREQDQWRTVAVYHSSARRSDVEVPVKRRTKSNTAKNESLCPKPNDWQDVWKIIVGEYCPTDPEVLARHQELAANRR